ncbi:MAG TPA: LLM class flavin-dependent oxidoreductase [Ilumatobacter sp.]|nr:LLM class flavin-dependent oxidoreductase [Ilumatobacter sp.]
MAPQLGVQLSPNGATVGQIVEAAVAYEAAGFESVWCGDHLVDYFGWTREVASECFVTLTAVAAATSRVQIGSMVVSSLFRAPALLAQMAGTLADYSGDRLELGLGTGGVKAEHLALGFPWMRRGDRLRRVRDLLLVLRALQGSEPVTFESETVTLDGAIGHPALGKVPLLVSALAEGTARLAGRYADGVITNDYAEIDSRAVIDLAKEAAATTDREISVAMMIPDRETTVAGGRHAGAGIERSERMGADRVIYRLLPPYPEPSVVLDGGA